MAGMNLVTLRSELRQHLGTDDIELPKDDADLLLNRSYWQIQEELKLPVNTTITTFNTVAHTPSYAIAYPQDGIYSLALKDVDNENLDVLDAISENTYLEEVSLNADNEGKPEKYIVRGTNLYLLPTPEAVYEIRVNRREILSDLSDSNQNLTIDNSLHEILLLGAVWRGHSRNRNYDASFKVQTFVTNLLAAYVMREVKDQSNWKYAQVKPILNTYNP